MRRLISSIVISVVLLSHSVCADDDSVHSGEAFSVVVSVQPIALILREIAPKLQVKVLINGSKSAHHYALSPSDVIAIKQADVVFWFGKENEPYLGKVVSLLPEDQAIRLLDSNSPAHAWWNPAMAKDMARQMTEVLAEKQPNQRRAYDQGYQGFVERLDKTVMTIRQSRYPKTVAVAHDAYSGLLSFLDIRQVGALADSADHRHGARTVDKIRHAALAGSLACLIEEPQASTALPERLVAGTSVKRIVIDPLGRQSANYNEFLRDAALQLQSCIANLPQGATSQDNPFTH